MAQIGITTSLWPRSSWLSVRVIYNVIGTYVTWYATQLVHNEHTIPGSI